MKSQKIKITLEDILPLIHKFLLINSKLKVILILLKLYFKKTKKIHQQKLSKILRNHLKQNPLLLEDINQKKNDQVDRKKKIHKIKQNGKQINGHKQVPKKKLQFQKQIFVSAKHEPSEDENDVQNQQQVSEKIESENEEEESEYEEISVEQEVEESDDEDEKREKEKQRKLKKDIEEYQKEIETQLKQQTHMDRNINKKRMIKVNHDKTRFSRVSGVDYINADLLENSYNKKTQQGHQDEYGKLGWERLGGTRGKEFRKQKNKLKKREFQGTKLSNQNNLIDID